MQLHNRFDFLMIQNKKRRGGSKGHLTARGTARGHIFSVLNQCYFGGPINRCGSNAQAPQKGYIFVNGILS